MRRSEWGKSVEIHRTNVGIPKRIWAAAKVRALKESRNFEEIVAEALEDYLKKKRKGERNAD